MPSQIIMFGPCGVDVPNLGQGNESGSNPTAFELATLSLAETSSAPSAGIASSGNVVVAHPQCNGKVTKALHRGKCKVKTAMVEVEDQGQLKRVELSQAFRSIQLRHRCVRRFRRARHQGGRGEG